MERYPSDDIRRFLRAVDARLNRRCVVIIIGGSGAGLAYATDLRTHDIDTYNRVPAYLAAAAQKARVDTGLDIPITHSAVADLPYDFENRLEQPTIGRLRHLEVWVPEKHDLVLSKTLRGYEHDLDAVAEIHRRHTLDAELLVDRYIDEMGHAIGEKSRLDCNLFAMLARVFGDDVAKRAERRLAETKR